MREKHPVRDHHNTRIPLAAGGHLVITTVHDRSESTTDTLTDAIKMAFEKTGEAAKKYDKSWT